MTMRFAHIGINDQARAIKSLPVPCQDDIVRKPADFAFPDKSGRGSKSQQAATADNSSTLATGQLMTLKIKKGHRLTKTVSNGGGGN